MSPNICSCEKWKFCDFVVQSALYFTQLLLSFMMNRRRMSARSAILLRSLFGSFWKCPRETNGNGWKSQTR